MISFMMKIFNLLTKAGNMEEQSRLEKQLEQHEGYRKHPYKCTAGKTTIGIGRNLEDVGLTREEALYLLRNDIARATGGAKKIFSNFNDISEVRQDCIVNMCLNMGAGGLSKFKNMIKAVESLDFEKASIEMLDSKWKNDVGYRALDLAEQMRTGEYK